MKWVESAAGGKLLLGRLMQCLSARKLSTFLASVVPSAPDCI